MIQKVISTTLFSLSDFLIETKNWSGKVNFSNNRISIDNKILKNSPIRQVKDSALELIDYLDNKQLKAIPVRLILCFIGSDLDQPIVNINGVVICSGESLIDVISDDINNCIEESLLLKTKKFFRISLNYNYIPLSDRV